MNHLPWKPRRRAVPILMRPLSEARNKRETPSSNVRVTADTRTFVWRRDKGRCSSCGSKQKLQFDHIIPSSWGGSSGPENIQILCQTCNLRKGAKLDI